MNQTLITRTLEHGSAPQYTSSVDEGTRKKLARGEAAEEAAASRSITAISWVEYAPSHTASEIKQCGLVAAFSDGTVTSWKYSDESSGWREYVLVGHDPQRSTLHENDGVSPENLHESIADISCLALCDELWVVATSSSKGIILHASDLDEKVFSRHLNESSAAASVYLQHHTKENNAESRDCFLFAGSASPRHNKVLVYTISHSVSNARSSNDPAWVSLPTITVNCPLYHGHLLGHQDWITTFAYLPSLNTRNGIGRSESILASSGHDAKIRLWKFTTYPSLTEQLSSISEQDGDSDVDEDIIDDIEEEEGEARLLISHDKHTTAVSLEALLLGHEEAVTSLSWRPPVRSSSKDCLLSSSMDRTILIWMEEDYEADGAGGGGGVWSPISRVGSAGGILGGSIGASLMGFVDATFSPCATRIVGHGYGGSIHFWTMVPQSEMGNGEEEDDVIYTARWLSDPCITGHFRPVLDMAWDAQGDYLLTTSSDQTTRLWMEVPTTEDELRWVEVGRPQVHGYDMTSITCIGGQDDTQTEESEPSHRFVSGADEKVLRVFDAPMSALRLVSSLKRSRDPSSVPSSIEHNLSWRVERAFMPSLGLTNKATADADQESSKYAGQTNAAFDSSSAADVASSSVELQLPSERDLGVTALWPETRQLFGHDSELVCLDSYRAPAGEMTLVASSCKARNDVASAAIRLWHAKEGKCVAILKGGHRSTVSTMSFSSVGNLASSGKDRRICIWQKNGNAYDLTAAADSAHKRIIWSIHFCPKCPEVIASGSRDGFVKIWRLVPLDDGGLQIKELYKFEPRTKGNKKSEPVTAVAFAGTLLDDAQALLAIGTESGRLEVWAVPLANEESSPSTVHVVPLNDCHFDTVKKIAWRPNSEPSENSTRLTFASCGQDNAVRMHILT